MLMFLIGVELGLEREPCLPRLMQPLPPWPPLPMPLSQLADDDCDDGSSWPSTTSWRAASGGPCGQTLSDMTDRRARVGPGECSHGA